MSYLISYTCTKATPSFERPRAESPVACATICRSLWGR